MGSLSAVNLLLALYLGCAMLIVHALWAVLHTLAVWLVKIENTFWVSHRFRQCALRRYTSASS
jgi:ABC-type uncharacterized transport system permease subunit